MTSHPPVEPRRRGRPRSAQPATAAERMRRYRARRLASGLVGGGPRAADPALARIDFSKAPLLTPSEQEALRRLVAFVGRFREPPARIAIFGSRAKGGSTIDSDLDVAVFVDQPSGALERRVLAAAARAHAPYQVEGATLVLRPVLLGRRGRSALHDAVMQDIQVVWTRPR